METSVNNQDIGVPLSLCAVVQQQAIRALCLLLTQQDVWDDWDTVVSSSGLFLLAKGHVIRRDGLCAMHLKHGYSV